ncbi:hypothetical protein FRB99_001287 [Tulasnella sp. 403]|nr:hypothetical protein FRB99_001287 [Tulasnella sp. 403]
MSTDSGDWITPFENAVSHRLKFQDSGDALEIGSAVESAEQALELCTTDQFMRCRILQTLGDMLKCRFLKTGANSDLYRAIDIYREAATS